jgi:hypothetical protein
MPRYHFQLIIINPKNKPMPLSKAEQHAGAIISMLAIVLLLFFLIVPAVGFGDEILALSLLAGIFLLSAICCIIVVRRYRKQNMPLVIDYFNVDVQRYILGLFMIFYGMPKLFGNFFDYQLFALDSKLSEVSEFELAWYYFGKNRWQELFSGIMEFVPGLLLLSRRTYYIAALILLPVAAQVFVLNLFFKIGGVTFPAASILLACNIYILYSQKEKIILFFRSLNLRPERLLGKRTFRFIKVLRGLSLCLVALVMFMNINRAFLRSDSRRKYEKLVGMYTLQAMKKNNSTYTPTNDSIYYKDLYIEKQDRWNILRRFNNTTDAFILKLNKANDSISLYINKGGTGDAPDAPDTVTVLRGRYKLDKNTLTISGVQGRDTLQLIYKKQPLKPKVWFW